MAPCSRFFLPAFLFPFAVLAADFNAANSTNQVGLDIFQQLAGSHATDNLILSPYSIESALALAYAGASGATRAEMAKALHLPDDDSIVSAGFQSLSTSLDDLVAPDGNVEKGRPGGRKPPVIQWSVANRLFGQSEYPFLRNFLTLMRDSYHAPFQAVDFRHDSANVRQSINGWVAEQTRDKIRDLIPPDGVSDTTRLVLVNALYLKAPWNSPFDKKATAPRPFHFGNGDTRDVPTMRKKARFGYAREDDATIVTMDYAGSALQFVIVLPDEGVGPDLLMKRLSPERLAQWVRLGWHGHRPEVELYFPKFRAEPDTIRLGKTLRELGMGSAFDEPRGSADFGRIAPRKPDDYLALSDVFHRTFIAVDEEGTEAAAATGVTMVTLAAVAVPEKPIVVHVDRPFLFLIQHRPTGTCLFLGRISRP